MLSPFFTPLPDLCVDWFNSCSSLMFPFLLWSSRAPPCTSSQRLFTTVVESCAPLHFISAIVYYCGRVVRPLALHLSDCLLLWSSREHPFTARWNFISATVYHFHLCASISSLHFHIKGMELPRSYQILIGLLSLSVFSILVVSCHTLLEILPVLFVHLRHNYTKNCKPSN
jgi:hypothetical protein